MTPGPPPTGSKSEPIGHPRKLLGLMTGLFFAFGFCTVLVDTLIPRLKAIFQLSYAEVMLTQFCYFAAYALISGPAGWLIGKIGYLRAVTVGLVLMTTGCILFTPAAELGRYAAFLGALFVLASGVTIVQVAANPLTSSLGAPEGASSRLTLAQAFNSVATMVGPLFGSAFLLAHAIVIPTAGSTADVLLAARVRAAESLTPPYLWIAAGLAVLALVCWFARRWSPASVAQQGGSYRHLLGRRRLMLGALTIFAYVGAEVSIGSAMINYLMQDQVIGRALAGLGRFISRSLAGGQPVSGAQAAADLVSVYWGGAMIGRFVGAVVLRRAPSGLVLAACAMTAATLTAVSGFSGGGAAALAILAVGLFNSIQFPTIFTLAIEGLGEDTPEGSGLLCVAIVGGALVPLATGLAADHLGLSAALVVPVVCYVWVAAYGLLCGRPVLAPAERFWPGVRGRAGRAPA